MDYHSLKRKELQELCKKHNLPANLTNLKMADSLASLFKVPDQVERKIVASLKGSSGGSGGVGGDTKVVKMVRFADQDKPNEEASEVTHQPDKKMKSETSQTRRKSLLGTQRSSSNDEDTQEKEVVHENYETYRRITRSHASKAADAVAELASVAEKEVTKKTRKPKKERKVPKAIREVHQPPPTVITVLNTSEEDGGNTEQGNDLEKMDTPEVAPKEPDVRSLRSRHVLIPAEEKGCKAANQEAPKVNEQKQNGKTRRTRKMIKEKAKDGAQMDEKVLIPDSRMDTPEVAPKEPDVRSLRSRHVLIPAEEKGCKTANQEAPKVNEQKQNGKTRRTRKMIKEKAKDGAQMDEKVLIPDSRMDTPEVAPKEPDVRSLRSRHVLIPAEEKGCKAANQEAPKVNEQKQNGKTRRTRKMIKEKAKDGAQMDEKVLIPDSRIHTRSKAAEGKASEELTYEDAVTENEANSTSSADMEAKVKVLTELEVNGVRNTSARTRSQKKIGGAAEEVSCENRENEQILPGKHSRRSRRVAAPANELASVVEDDNCKSETASKLQPVAEVDKTPRQPRHYASQRQANGSMDEAEEKEQEQVDHEGKILKRSKAPKPSKERMVKCKVSERQGDRLTSECEGDQKDNAGQVVATPHNLQLETAIVGMLMGNPLLPANEQIENKRSKKKSRNHGHVKHAYRKKPKRSTVEKDQISGNPQTVEEEKGFENIAVQCEHPGIKISSPFSDISQTKMTEEMKGDMEPMKEKQVSEVAPEQENMLFELRDQEEDTSQLHDQMYVTDAYSADKELVREKKDEQLIVQCRAPFGENNLQEAEPICPGKGENPLNKSVDASTISLTSPDSKTNSHAIPQLDVYIDEADDMVDNDVMAPEAVTEERDMHMPPEALTEERKMHMSPEAVTRKRNVMSPEVVTMEKNMDAMDPEILRESSTTVPMEHRCQEQGLAESEKICNKFLSEIVMAGNHASYYCQSCPTTNSPAVELSELCKTTPPHLPNTNVELQYQMAEAVDVATNREGLVNVTSEIVNEEKETPKLVSAVPEMLLGDMDLNEPIGLREISNIQFSSENNADAGLIETKEIVRDSAPSCMTPMSAVKEQSELGKFLSKGVALDESVCKDPKEDKIPRSIIKMPLEFSLEPHVAAESTGKKPDMTSSSALIDRVISPSSGQNELGKSSTTLTSTNIQLLMGVDLEEAEEANFTDEVVSEDVDEDKESPTFSKETAHHGLTKDGGFREASQTKAQKLIGHFVSECEYDASCIITAMHDSEPGIITCDHLGEATGDQSKNIKDNHEASPLSDRVGPSESSHVPEFDSETAEVLTLEKEKDGNYLMTDLACEIIDTEICLEFGGAIHTLEKTFCEECKEISFEEHHMVEQRTNPVSTEFGPVISADIELVSKKREMATAEKSINENDPEDLEYLKDDTYPISNNLSQAISNECQHQANGFTMGPLLMPALDNVEAMLPTKVVAEEHQNKNGYSSDEHAASELSEVRKSTCPSSYDEEIKEYDYFDISCDDNGGDVEKTSGYINYLEEVHNGGETFSLYPEVAENEHDIETAQEESDQEHEEEPFIHRQFRTADFDYDADSSKDMGSDIGSQCTSQAHEAKHDGIQEDAYIISLIISGKNREFLSYKLHSHEGINSTTANGVPETKQDTKSIPEIAALEGATGCNLVKEVSESVPDATDKKHSIVQGTIMEDDENTEFTPVKGRNGHSPIKEIRQYVMQIKEHNDCRETMDADTDEQKVGLSNWRDLQELEANAEDASKVLGFDDCAVENVKEENNFALEKHNQIELEGAQYKNETVESSSQNLSSEDAIVVHAPVKEIGRRCAMHSEEHKNCSITMDDKTDQQKVKLANWRDLQDIEASTESVSKDLGLDDRAVEKVKQANKIAVEENNQIDPKGAQDKEKTVESNSQNLSLEEAVMDQTPVETTDVDADQQKDEFAKWRELLEVEESTEGTSKGMELDDCAAENVKQVNRFAVEEHNQIEPEGAQNKNETIESSSQNLGPEDALMVCEENIAQTRNDQDEDSTKISQTELADPIGAYGIADCSSLNPSLEDARDISKIELCANAIDVGSEEKEQLSRTTITGLEVGLIDQVKTAVFLEGSENIHMSNDQNHEALRDGGNRSNSIADGALHEDMKNLDQEECFYVETADHGKGEETRLENMEKREHAKKNDEQAQCETIEIELSTNSGESPSGIDEIDEICNLMSVTLKISVPPAETSPDHGGDVFLTTSTNEEAAVGVEAVALDPAPTAPEATTSPCPLAGNSMSPAISVVRKATVGAETLMSPPARRWDYEGWKENTLGLAVRTRSAVVKGKRDETAMKTHTQGKVGRRALQAISGKNGADNHGWLDFIR